ncbi:MAG: hypothetical protein ABIH86_02005, partial [Planctomycetota bacterium]
MSHPPTFNRFFGRLFRFFFPKHGINDPSRVEDGWAPDSISRFRKWLHRGLAMIVVPLGIAIIVWSIFLSYYSRQLSSRLEELRDQKLLLSIEAIWQPPVPDEVNSFIPLAEIALSFSDLFLNNIKTMDNIDFYLMAKPDKKEYTFQELPPEIQSLSETEMKALLYEMAFSTEMNDISRKIKDAMKLPEFNPFYDDPKSNMRSFKYFHVPVENAESIDRLRNYFQVRVLGMHYSNNDDVVEETVCSSICFSDRILASCDEMMLLHSMTLFFITKSRLSMCIEKDYLSEKHLIHLLQIMINSEYSIPPIERIWLQLCRIYISETERRINTYKK